MTFYIVTIFEFAEGGFKTISDYYTAPTKADAVAMARETTFNTVGNRDGVFSVSVCGEV